TMAVARATPFVVMPTTVTSNAGRCVLRRAVFCKQKREKTRVFSRDKKLSLLPLLYNHKIVPAVLGPGNLVMPVQQELLLAPADGIHPRFIDAEVDKIPLGALGPALSKGQVVLF